MAQAKETWAQTRTEGWKRRHRPKVTVLEAGQL